jgi:hypothetical protein
LTYGENFIETNGEKIITNDELVLQWPLQARLLKWSIKESNTIEADKKLAGLLLAAA